MLIVLVISIFVIGVKLLLFFDQPSCDENGNPICDKDGDLVYDGFRSGFGLLCCLICFLLGLGIIFFAILGAAF